MPKIPVDECPAGRAMDAAVAEVLGWHIESWQDESDGGYHLCDQAGNHVKPWAYDKDPEWRWLPSTDIAAAWELKPKGEYEFLNVAHFAYGYVEIDWHGDKYYYSQGETVPLAICRAFLKANGVEFVEVQE